MLAPGLLAQPRHGAALRGRGRRDPVPAGRDQVNETLGVMRAGADAAGALVADSTLDALRAAWRSDVSSGTRA
jgi:hypothetical protein